MGSLQTPPTPQTHTAGFSFQPFTLKLGLSQTLLKLVPCRRNEWLTDFYLLFNFFFFLTTHYLQYLQKAEQKYTSVRGKTSPAFMVFLDDRTEGILV